MELHRKYEESPQILIVDDVDANRMILESIIQEMGCRPVCAASANEAAKQIGESLPQLILLDVFMPEIDGYEFCERLKKNPVTRDIPIIFISAADSSQDKVRGLKVGAVDYITKPFEMAEVIMRVSNHLELHKMRQELELSNRRLHSVINSQARRIEEEQKNILYALAALAQEESASCPTQGSAGQKISHGAGEGGDPVAYNCSLLAQSLQFSPDFTEEISERFIETIEVASRLRNLGNFFAPDTFCTSQAPLGQKELLAAGRHAKQCVAFLERMHAYAPNNPFLPMAIEIAGYRHARWDGGGCPQGLGGKEIPLSARITAAADFFCTLAGTCPDSSRKDVLRQMEQCSGVILDPEIVNIFLKIEKQLKATNEINKTLLIDK